MSDYHEFTDEDDEVFRAERYGGAQSDFPVIELSRFPNDGDKPSRIVFYAGDAEKIIKLIQAATL
jgi:hypothetical protein